MTARHRKGQEAGAREALEQAIDAALLRHGSYRNAAKALCVDHVYLHRLRAGTRDSPSGAVLAALGVTRHVTYREAIPQQARGRGAP